MLFVAGVAGAANISNIEWENGDTEIQGRGGETVDATLRIVVPAGEVVEMLQTDVISDGLGPICESVGGSRGLEQGTHYVDVEVKLPPNTGTYDLDAQASGIFGGQRSIDCEEDVVDDTTFSDAIRVVGSSNNDDDDEELGDDDDLPSWLQALIAALMGNKPDKPAYCTQLATYAGLSFGMNGSQVSALQALLVGNGFSIPALSQGVAYGFYGSQTAAAHGAAKANCN